MLSGTLGDEFGDYGPGTYLKNPPGSSHAPFSEEGCTLFVKLRHLSPDDSERVVVSTHQSPWFRGMVDGLTVMPLCEFGTTHTAIGLQALNHPCHITVAFGALAHQQQIAAFDDAAEVGDRCFVAALPAPNVGQQALANGGGD